MDPLTIAALGSTALSTLFGFGESSKNRKAQEQIANQQLQIAREQQQLAEEMARRGLATQIDANGNVTYYDNATNTWKTVLSPTQQAIQDLSDQEQINQLRTDAPLNRIESLVNARRRSQEGVAANGALASLTDSLASPTRASDLASQLRLDRTNAVNKGFDDVSASIGTQALRSGASGGGAIAAQLAKQRSQAIAQTMGSPEIEGMQLATDLNNSRQSQLGNIYNVLAGRASGAPIQTFNPSGVASGANAALSGARNASAQASAMQGNLNSAAGNIIGNINTPDYTKGGLGSLFSGVSDILGLFAGGGGGSVAETIAKRKTTTGTTGGKTNSWSTSS